jgi:hypothetical protein
MDASQLWYPETLHSVPKHKFCIFSPVEGLRNAPKHSETSFWVQWSRMDASQLRYLETVYLVPKHKFCIFYLSNVIEMLWNTPKHHFGSNGVEWMVHSFRIPKLCIQAQTQVLHLFRVEGLRNALKHSRTSIWVQWSTMDASQFGTPKHCIQSQNTSCASFYLSKVSEMLWNTPKHYFWSNGVEWMVHNFGTPK